MSRNIRSSTLKRLRGCVPAIITIVAMYGVIAATGVIAESIQHARNATAPQTPAARLRTAIHRGDVEAVADALASGADCNALDEAQCTPLILAVRCGSPAVVKLLLDHGAAVNDSTPTGSALMTAAVYGNTEIASMLLDHGADPNAGTPDGNTPVWSIIQCGEEGTHCLRVLLDAGAIADCRRANGQTPLMSAVSEGYAALAAVLIDGGADVQLAAHDGTTAEALAIASGNRDLFRLIRQGWHRQRSQQST